jgi:hypothetical protein
MMQPCGCLEWNFGSHCGFHEAKQIGWPGECIGAYPSCSYLAPEGRTSQAMEKRAGVSIDRELEVCLQMSRYPVHRLFDFIYGASLPFQRIYYHPGMVGAGVAAVEALNRSQIGYEVRSR